MAMFSLATVQAQSSASYLFNTDTAGSLVLDANGNTVNMSTGTTQLLGAGVDDTISALTALNLGTGGPFNFLFMGRSFTQFAVSDNGLLTLGATPGTSTYLLGGTTPTISAFANDMRVGTDGRVVAKIVGTAPNRTIVVQWTNNMIRYLGTAAAGTATWQVRLYEASGIIEYVYGSIGTNTSTPTAYNVGFSVNTTANSVLSLNTTTNTVSTAATPATTNTYTASSTIAALHSTADGSRRVYRLTPPTIVSGDVTNLAFTAVTSNGTTLSWDDNATNEIAFFVTRDTDAAFTQNVVTTTVATTTTSTTGTSYTSAQTGLSTGTTYFYRVTALVEAGQSTGITGNQATLTGATYYYTGATGGNWDSFTNWNTAADGSGSAPTVWATSDTLIFDGAGTTPGGALSIIVDRTNFTTGQIRITSNTNLTLESSAASTRLITISGGPNEDFLLEAGSALYLVSVTNPVAFLFTGSGNTGTIAGAYNTGGSTSNRIETTGGTGTIVTVAATGIITNNIPSTTTGCISGTTASLLFTNGSNFITNATNNYIPTATWQPNATATLNGNTTGTSISSSSPSLGNLVINTTASSATLSAFTSNVRTILGDLTVNSTGTGRFRAITTGVLQVNGNLVINTGIFEVGSSTGGGVIVRGTTTVAPGAILDVNQSALQIEGNMVNNGSVLSSETTTVNSRIIFVSTVVAQTFTGSGTFTGRVSSIGVSNPLGLTIATPVLTQRVNLFTGTVTGSGNITIGTGLALGAAVQIGTANNTNSGGSFDASPVFNLGTGTYTLLYLGETTGRTTGFEIPATRIVNTLILDNVNGLTIAGGTVEVLSGLTLTNGIVNATLANHIIHSSSTTAGTLTGGSATSYINGPIVRTINNSNAASNYIVFPVGKAGVYNPVAIAPTTTSAARFRAEAFNTNAGTSDPSIIGLSTTRRFEAVPVSGTFDEINVRLSDAGIVATNIPVQAPTAAGVYSSAFGSTATFVAGPPVTITSNFPVTSANYTGFLSYANSNACMGTPAPGNTIASTSTICLGESVTLSLENTTSGSGVTYQWRSSTDGTTYTDIAGATSITYVASPTAATFYQASVTCASGSSSALSTPVQITYTNNVATTTPATICGVGTATLSATPNTGATINWFSSVTGGAALAFGNSFTTPSINATTTYFASASTATSGTVAVGTATTLTAATTQPTAFCNRWPNYWMQTIYTAAELNATGLSAGNITSLAYNIASLGDAATNANFTVRIGSTGLNAFTSSTFLDTSAYTNVFGPATFTHTASGLQTVNFTTPYVWDGVSNIVINVTMDGADSFNNSQTFFTETPDNKVLWATSFSGTTTSGTTSVNRLNIILGGQVLCKSARVPVTATVTAPPALTLSASSLAICESESSAAVTVTSTISEYDTYVWSPATGVSGNQTTGWIFNPAVSTVYTLTASQTTGSLCTTTTTVDITVNSLPTAITIAPAAASVCVDTVQSLVASGGAIGSLMDSQVGTATTLTGATSQPTAFCNRFEHYWVQMVYTAAELNAAGVQAGNITALRFKTGAQGSADNVTDFKVRLGNTTNSVLTAFTTSGLTQVFSAATYTTVVGVNTITFDTPYAWDGTSNIIVDMRQTGIDTTNNATTEFTATSGNTVVYAITSSTIAGGSDGFAATAPSPITSTNRLNTTFALDSSIPTLITWSPATNLFTDAAATVAYVANDNAASVYFRSPNAGVSNYTVTASSAAGCSTTATTAVTTVDCGIPYANLQFPGAANITNCESQTFFAKVFKAGVTEAAGQGAGIQAWIGRNTTNTDPATWAESSWQLATFNVQVGNDDEYQATFGPSTAGTYYVASRFVFAPGSFVYGGYTATGGGIWDGTSNVSAVLTVENVPAPTAVAQTICNAGTVADLVATGTGLQWYTTATGGTVLPATTALSTGDYFVSQTQNGCESERTPVAVTVTTVSTPIGAATQIITGFNPSDATIANIVVSGTNIIWYPTSADAAAATNPLAVGTQLVNGSTYYAVSVVGTCRSAALAVTVTVTLGVESFDISSLKFYPNPVSDILTVRYSQNITGIAIYDLSGRKLMDSKTNETTVAMNVHELAASVYVVKVFADNQTTEFKIVKQ